MRDQRILICGGPATGKTTLSLSMGKEMGIPVRHTDDLIGKFDWSAASATVADWLAEPGPWIIEGVAVPRALRKWLAQQADQTIPADKIIFLDKVWVAAQTTGQKAMAKGLLTVWEEILPALRRLGVTIERASHA